MTVADDTVTDVADRLFSAIESGDRDAIRRLCDDDIVVWKVADRDRDKERALRVLYWFIDATSQRRYEVIDRRLFDGGLVQQHILHATGHNGGAISMRVGIIIKIDANGLISRIDEYFDPAEIAPLLESASDSSADNPTRRRADDPS